MAIAVAAFLRQARPVLPRQRLAAPRGAAQVASARRGPGGGSDAPVRKSSVAGPASHGYREDMRRWVGGVAALLLVAAIVPVSAHHTVASFFDTRNLVTLQGTLTNVDWRNPHVILRLETRRDNGDPVSWHIETLNVQGLSRQGLTQTSFKPGAAFSAKVCVARDGTRWAVTHTLTTPDGSIDLRVGGC